MQRGDYGDLIAAAGWPVEVPLWAGRPLEAVKLVTGCVWRSRRPQEWRQWLARELGVVRQR